LGAGGPLGNGRQWWSWVHRDDVIGLILHTLETPAAGPLNVVSPNPVRMGNFAKALGGVLHRPAVLPAPGFALRLALGEMADSLLLGSQRVVPEATLASGYTFRHPDLVPALRAILAT
jgi:NAD dependent epimerase/dehydratase family enzyme